MVGDLRKRSILNTHTLLFDFLHSVLHSYGKEHKDILSSLFIFLGLNIYARKCAGHGYNHPLTAAGANAVYEESVVEGYKRIASLMDYLDLVIGRAYGRISRDGHYVTVYVKTDVRTGISGDSLLRYQSGALESGKKFTLIKSQLNTVILDDDAIVINVLSVDKS